MKIFLAPGPLVSYNLLHLAVLCLSPQVVNVFETCVATVLLNDVYVC